LVGSKRSKNNEGSSSDIGTESAAANSGSDFGSSDSDSDSESSSDADTDGAAGRVEGEVGLIVAPADPSLVVAPNTTEPETCLRRPLCPKAIDAHLLKQSQITSIKICKDKWAVLVAAKPCTWLAVGDGSRAALWAAIDNKPNDLVHEDIDNWMSAAQAKPNSSCPRLVGDRQMTRNTARCLGWSHPNHLSTCTTPQFTYCLAGAYANLMFATADTQWVKNVMGALGARAKFTTPTSIKGVPFYTT